MSPDVDSDKKSAVSGSPISWARVGCVLFTLVAACNSPAVDTQVTEVGYSGPLPDFDGDRFNAVMDARTGAYLRPALPGSVFEWPSAAPVDWNGDGLFDLIVGYNLREPDVMRMVVYVNQGQIGTPAFTGEPSPVTCFYLEATYPHETHARIFEAEGRHLSHIWIGYRPRIIDLNGDGRFDILVNEGTYDLAEHRGQWLLLNEGEPGHPRFRAVFLQGDSVEQELPPGPYTVAMQLLNRHPAGEQGAYPSVDVVDWDSDGIEDISYSVQHMYLIFGDRDASGRWRPRKPRWEPVVLADGDSFHGVQYIVTVDLDRDGVNEVLVANPFKPNVPDGYLSLYVRDRARPGEVRYTLARAELFSLNGDAIPWWRSLFFPRHGWWHPRITALDYDEDGDPDILAGWGGGNGQRHYGERMYLYRTPGGRSGSAPMFRRRD